MNLIPLTHAHIDRLLHIEQASFPTPWNSDTMTWALSEMDIHGIGLSAGNDLIGYAFLRHSIIDGIPFEQADLLNIAVDPAYRGRGYGKILLSHIMNLAWTAGTESIFLEVRTSNTNAQKLYSAMGFTPIGVRKDYYCNLHPDTSREDAVVMMASAIV
ncbi:MAG: ribosomal protein S18-alanine N-acetyltransferase [Oscillospiraceae bacterium]|nr:ribosomal protein S18-alanine N-acetyltransferase [Oscillospiraceae bacterium]